MTLLFLERKENMSVEKTVEEKKMIGFYECVFEPDQDGDSYSILIKGTRKPSIEEAEMFLAADIKRLGLPKIVEIIDRSGNVIRGLDDDFDLTRLNDWKVFGK